MQLSEQEVIRREKLDALRNLGINPYPAHPEWMLENTNTFRYDFFNYLPAA